MKYKLLTYLFIFSFIVRISGQEKLDDYEVRTIAFYNLENLFDTINNPKKFDDDRTPNGKDQYTSKIYWDKIEKLSSVISEIGIEIGQTSPVLMGVCEIENGAVLNDLIKTKNLQKSSYNLIHFDSPDERGIDVALLYRKQHFKPIHSQIYPLLLYNEKGKRDYTRDQLVVTGSLDGELIHIIVNHWPSRSGGEARSNSFRMAAAELNMKIIDSIQEMDDRAKIITMGDFNDDPTNKSISRVLNAKASKQDVAKNTGLFNPMVKMFKRGLNTLAYRDKLHLFDQIILSQPFIESEYNQFTFFKAGIYNKAYLTLRSGQFKGYPFRSYHNNSYRGGYSDHFPVYIYLIRRKNDSAIGTVIKN